MVDGWMAEADSHHDEDAEQVGLAAAGDADAFAQLYTTHRERVYRLAYHYVHNQPDALDLCQEVFVRAFEALPGFKGEARFRTWLMRIASNTCIDHLRHGRLRKTAELDEHLITSDVRLPGVRSAPDPTAGAERGELRAAIEAAVAKLSPEHRDVFVLHDVEGLTYQEVAETIGCPVGTVMSRLHYARRRLQGLLAWLNRE